MDSKKDSLIKFKIIEVLHIINAINCLRKAFYSVLNLEIQINNKEIFINILYT